MLSSKRTLALTAALTLIAAAPAAAAHRTTTMHKYTAMVTSTPLATSAGYPKPGSSALLSGSVASTPLGAGTLTDLITVMSNPEPNVFAYEGAEVDQFAHGAIASTLTGTDTVQADGTQKVVVHGHLTGGTARYRGVTGHYTFQGTVQPGATVLHGHSHGEFSH